MGFTCREIAGTAHIEQAFGGAEDLFHSKTAFRNQFIEAFLRGAQGAVSDCFMHDPIFDFLVFQMLTVCLRRIGFVGKETLCFCAFF